MVLSSNGNASEMKANESFDANPFARKKNIFETKRSKLDRTKIIFEVKRTRLILRQLFSKRKRTCSIVRKLF